MKNFFKGLALFLLFLFIYFIPALVFKSNPEYYASLNKPFYAPPMLLFGIVWPILYAIFSIILAIRIRKRTLTKEQMLYFILNYGISFFFNKVFFINHQLFMSFVVTFLSFVTGLILFVSIRRTSKGEGLALLPYLLWTGFASVLMAHIYFIN